MYKFGTVFVKFISKYFIPFDAIIDEIFLNFILDCSLKVDRNTIAILKCILYILLFYFKFIYLCEAITANAMTGSLD